MPFPFFNKFNRKPATPATVPVTVEETLHVPLNLMNAHFDRSAGRWCDVCDQNGSHHTDRHNDFALAVLNALPVTH